MENAGVTLSDCAMVAGSDQLGKRKNSPGAENNIESKVPKVGESKEESESQNQRGNKKKGSAGKHLKCDVCSRLFGDNYKLNRHKLIHTGEKPFKCEYCQKCFARKDKYTPHVRRHVENGTDKVTAVKSH
ncbi:zinc finger protein 600 [Biomphalaria glabrata]|uniref:C2H2-type domain-containing protein n=2 Tax=Biomphalaria TaxID=6525 RepID=A0A182ZWS9_BIOGL|nr:zinc finger protein 600-like [Biomphalaria glabrata]KAI8785958.1 zinc finger protein 600 [Biomphalaria glabrata]KAK0067822.1 zinc finger protein 600 [Biomphalaria pfeifferi]